MSAWEAARTTLPALVEAVKGESYAEEVRRLASRVEERGGRPDPFLSRVFSFISKRIPQLRKLEAPWAAPEFRLFSEAFMYSLEFSGLLWKGLTSVKRREGAVVDLHSGPGVTLEYAARLWDRLVAVDPCDENLDAVEERLRSMGFSEYALVKADYTGFVGKLSEIVGLLVIASPSNWLYEPRWLISRAYTALPPGGRLLILLPLEWERPNPLTPFVAALGGSVYSLTVGRVRTWLEGEGFTSIKVRRGEVLTLLTATKP